MEYYINTFFMFSVTEVDVSLICDLSFESYFCSSIEYRI